MNTKILGTTAFLALSGLLALGGCSGSPTGADPTPAASESPAASETTSSNATDQDCVVAEVSGTSKNKELMALAAAQYEALDCSGDLFEQLQTLSKDPSLQKKAKSAGWDLTTGDAVGAITLRIVDVEDLTTCAVTAGNTPVKAKQMICGDL